MKITLDLPEKLRDEAMKITHIATRTAAIIKALEKLVRKSKIPELKKHRGKIDLDIDLNDLRDRRWKY